MAGDSYLGAQAEHVLLSTRLSKLLHCFSDLPMAAMEMKARFNWSERKP